MAMRPTFRNGEAAVRPVYEDFRPMVEWQQDEESNILLLIYVPGFQRENLKVTTEGSSILRIRGERLITGNKWSRFQEDYPIPEDCNVRGSLARFEVGILTITIPRKIEVIKDASTIKEPTKAPQDTMPKPSQKIKEDLSTQKQQQISPPKKAPEKTQQKVADDISGPTAIPPVSALKTKKVVDQVEDILREKEVIKPKLHKDKGKILEPKERKATRVVAASSRSDYGLASYKQTVKQFLESNEDRQLLVNVGGAVLVLVAFGVYLSYTIHDKLREI